MIESKEVWNISSSLFSFDTRLLSHWLFSALTAQKCANILTTKIQKRQIKVLWEVFAACFECEHIGRGSDKNLWPYSSLTLLLELTRVQLFQLAAAAPCVTMGTTARETMEELILLNLPEPLYQQRRQNGIVSASRSNFLIWENKQWY